MIWGKLATDHQAWTPCTSQGHYELQWGPQSCFVWLHLQQSSQLFRGRAVTWVSPQVVCTAAITLVLALSRPPLRWRQRFFGWCPPTWKGGGGGSDRGSCESSEQRVEIHPSCLKTSPSMCFWLASIFWDDTVDDLYWFFHSYLYRLMAMGHCNVRISLSKLGSLCLLSLCYPPLSSLSLCSSYSMPGPFLAFCEYLQSVLTTTKRPTSTDDHMPGRIMAWPVAKYVFWWNEGYVLKCV